MRHRSRREKPSWRSELTVTLESPELEQPTPRALLKLLIQPAPQGDPAQVEAPTQSAAIVIDTRPEPAKRS